MSTDYPLDPIGRDTPLASPAAAKLGLWLFMGVVSVLFLLLSLAFLSRAQFDDWQALAGAPWLPLSSSGRLWANTVLLLTGSAALQWAQWAGWRGDARGARIGLLLGGLFAVAFLLGQLSLWQLLNRSGYLLAANPANSFFYLLTALHGLHLLGGLVAWGKTTAAAFGGTLTPRLKLHVQLCSRYWHFLLLLWLLLFALLASPPESLARLAALCGLR